MFDVSLLNLPWATLVVLVTGYVGYFIANVGLKDNHPPLEITFSTLVFGLLASLPYSLTLQISPPHLQTYLATFVALTFAFVTGSIWRKYGRKGMYRFLRKYNISWSDSTRSAWEAMFDHTEFSVTDVYVFLKDGSGLRSRLPGNYEGWPNGPFTLGNKGDMTLYVTHRLPITGNTWEEQEDVVHSSWGALATYIPAEQITRVSIRRIRVSEKA